MAKRYSGDVVVSVTWSDSRDAYKATVSAHGEKWSGWVGAPRAMRIAVDSPQAYDDAAHAAISFACDEEPGFCDVAGTNADCSGWEILRAKRRANPRHGRGRR